MIFFKEKYDFLNWFYLFNVIIWKQIQVIQLSEFLDYWKILF